MTARPATLATASSSIAGGMLSRSTASGLVRKRLRQLVERRDLDLDLDHVPGLRARALERRPDAAGRDDVIVLDEDRVEQPEAMIEAAAGAHGELLEGAQSRASSCAYR